MLTAKVVKNQVYVEPDAEPLRDASALVARILITRRHAGALDATDSVVEEPCRHRCRGVDQCYRGRPSAIPRHNRLQNRVETGFAEHVADVHAECSARYQRPNLRVGANAGNVQHQGNLPNSSF